MTESTSDITDALEALDEACDILKHEHHHPRYMDIAMRTLSAANAIMCECERDLFSDSEQIFVCDAMLIAIEALYENLNLGHEETM
jgi:hypothetical protein